jgi:hypothetical protein
MVLVFTESLRFTRCLQTEKPTTVMSAKEDNNGKESKEPDYDGDKDRLEVGRRENRRKSNYKIQLFDLKLNEITA